MTYAIYIPQRPLLQQEEREGCQNGGGGLMGRQFSLSSGTRDLRSLMEYSSSSDDKISPSSSSSDMSIESDGLDEREKKKAPLTDHKSYRRLQEGLKKSLHEKTSPILLEKNLRQRIGEAFQRISDSGVPSDVELAKAMLDSDLLIHATKRLDELMSVMSEVIAKGISPWLMHFWFYLEGTKDAKSVIKLITQTELDASMYQLLTQAIGGQDIMDIFDTYFGPSAEKTAEANIALYSQLNDPAAFADYSLLLLADKRSSPAL